MTKEISRLNNIRRRLDESALLQEVLGNKKQKYLLSVISEINRTANDPKKDLTGCKHDSIVSAIKQACDLNLEIDSRQHCHLVKYGETVNLQVGYRGYIFAIKRFYPDANIDCRLVYEGDAFTLKKEGDITTYSLDVANPFAPKDKVIGGFCYISYTSNGRQVSFCETMSLEEINKIKGCAKQDFIWKQWFEEKAKVAIIKRACKIHFSGIQEIATITEFDNENFDLEKEVDVTTEATFIDSEKAFELQELIKSKGQDEKEICGCYGVDSIIQLPLLKYKTMKEALNADN